ncbi:MAG: hypothetical protein M0R46_07215 [Candidatus Muirbacterium halophilum]|nr:hypothetical protein [Candidatus Muirbacterium halophilum]MCK9475689.1 hypothetical protein [Candidatus Muirbacterium halophilum]
MFIDSYFLIGEDISRSLSPEIYNFLFKKYNLNNCYSGFSFSINVFDEVISALIKIKNLQGFNVTYPFKKEIVKYTEPSEDVKIIGGANTVIKIKNRFFSFNTDGDGFVNFIKRNKILSKNFIIAGTGITAKSIAYSLYKNFNIKPVFITRNKYKANKDEFLKKYSNDLIEYNDIKRYRGYFFVNSTPVNVIDNKLKTNFDCDKIFDVNYNINNLAFYNGVILLIEQALINFKIFTGIDVFDDYYCIDKYLTEVIKNGNAN